MTDERILRDAEMILRRKNGTIQMEAVDYFLFPKLKFPLKWRHFQTVEENQCAVTRQFNIISKTAFLESMKKLRERASKCTDQGGMYFEE
jgi:hypothetical protein